MKTSLRLAVSVLLVCSFGINASYGKGYTIPIHSITIDKYDSDPSILIINLINNDSDSTAPLEVKWEILNNGFASAGWDYNFCDFSQCYIPPLPNGATDYLTLDGTFKLTVDSFYNKAVDASMQIKVWDVNDPNHPDTVTFAINATLLGIESSIVPPSSINIYPNPASNYINVQINQAGFKPVKAIIYNALGKAVSEQGITGKTNSLPLYDLPGGFYIITLRDQEGREAVKQFVKE